MESYTPFLGSEFTNNLVIAMASRLFHIYDIRKMATPAEERESSLKYMTRSLACMPNGEGPYLLYFIPEIINRLRNRFCLRSFSRRVFRPFTSFSRKEIRLQMPYRQTPNNVDHVWPVNSLAFHPTFNTFASAGLDATASIWDHKG